MVGTDVQGLQQAKQDITGNLPQIADQSKATAILLHGDSWNPEINFPFSYKDVATSATERAALGKAIYNSLEKELSGVIEKDSLLINLNQGNSNLSFTARINEEEVHIRVRPGGVDHYQIEKDRMDLVRSLSEEGKSRVAEIQKVGELGNFNGNTFSYSIQKRLNGIPLAEVEDLDKRTEVLIKAAQAVAPLHDIEDKTPLFSREESLTRLHETVEKAKDDSHKQRLLDAGIISPEQWKALRDRFISFEWNHNLDTCLVHGDLHTNNILYNVETDAVYVIDWEILTDPKARYKDNSGFAVLGKFREVVGFIPIGSTNEEQDALLAGFGIDTKTFASSPLKKDLNTIQLAMAVSVAGYFIDGANNNSPRAAKPLETIKGYIQNQLA